MNNFGILKDLLENYKEDLALNNKLMVALLIFISINLITAIINILSQHNLKSKDKKIISFKIKEEKKIHIFEEIYQKLDKISFFDGKNDTEEFLNTIQDTEKYMSACKIHFNKNERAVMYEITDYYKIVLVDYRKKDFHNETKLFSKLSDLYNK